MRTLVHMSDLHFNWVDPRLLGPLASLIHSLSPHLVVISGDLTQRALRSEFRAARRFLDTLPQPQLIVPGNHDVPMLNVFSRFTRSLHSYRSIITEDLAPFFLDEEIAVVGVNTARALTIKDGRINREQIEEVRARLAPLDDRITKIVVTHHPFDLPLEAGEGDLVGRASLAMSVFAECRIDLLLAGHMHATRSDNTAQRYKLGDYAALSIHAGTATSTRRRGELNSFNVIRIGDTTVAIDHMWWLEDSMSFVCAKTENFKHSPGGWSPHGSVRNIAIQDEGGT